MCKESLGTPARCACVFVCFFLFTKVMNPNLMDPLSCSCLWTHSVTELPLGQARVRQAQAEQLSPEAYHDSLSQAPGCSFG